MKKNIKILLLEDDRYFNDLLLAELRICVNNARLKTEFRFMFHTFTNACDLLTRLKISDFSDSYTIAYLDYYLGDGMTGSQIIKILREKSAGTAIVILSRSKSARGRLSPSDYDYFVLKDSSAAALCRLCLEQFLENRYL